MPDGQDPSHPISVPDKPALEGLEAKWTPRWEEQRRLPVRSLAAPRRRVRDRHAAADGQRVAARRARVLLHPHRRHRAVSAHARTRRLLSDGLGRQRAADRTPRAELLRRPLRAVAAVRPGIRAAGEARQAADAGLAAELHRALRPADRGGREGLRAPVALSGPVGRLVDDLRDHRSPGAAGVAAGVPAPAQRGSWPISSRRRRCGTSISGPPSRRPSSRIASSRAPITASASPGPTRGGFVEIETTRPELIPACVALVAHPDDERYQPLFGNERGDAVVRRARCRSSRIRSPIRKRARGIAMICTFGDVTDVVWWRELSLPVRAIIQPNGTLRPLTWGETGWESVDAAAAQQPLRRARRPLRGQGAHPHRRTAARDRRSHRRAAADHPRGQVLREGRSAARDHHQPAVVHQDDGLPRAPAAARPRSCSGIPPTCRRGSRTGSTG